MRLVDWRKAMGMTQTEFGGLVGVGFVTVSRWERGDRIPSPKFQRFVLIVTEGAVTPNDWVGG